MLKNYKIKKRLTVAFIIIASIASLSGIAGCIAMNYISSQYDYALANYGFSQGDIGKVLITFADARSATRAIIGYTDEKIIEETNKIHDEKKQACIDYMEVVKKTLTAPAEEQAYENAKAAMDKYWESDDKILALGNTTDEVASKQAQQNAYDELDPVYDTAYNYLQELMNLNVSTGTSMQSTLETLRIVLFLVILGVIILSMVASVFLGNNIARGIATPIIKLSERLKTFAQGQFSEEFPHTDFQDEVADMIHVSKGMAENLAAIIQDEKYRLEEMAKGNYTADSSMKEKYLGELETIHTSIHDVNEKMNATLHQISEAAEQVSAGSGNMAEAAQNLAEGATEQAGAVEEIMATITTLTENIISSAEGAEESYRFSKQYAEMADKSKEEMQGMVKTMERISETSKKIEGIIAEIEDIASQTNLLSLNASIEAARAGEAGKGFAVVADQIGKLAADSAQSAVNTRNLIMNVLSEINNGTQTAIGTADNMNGVVEGIKQMANKSKETSEQSKIQAESMKEVESGVNQISEVVQSNSATAEESSATSEELLAQAESLDSLVKQFKLRA